MLSNEMFKLGLTGGQLIGGLALLKYEEEDLMMKNDEKVNGIFWEIFSKSAEIEELVGKLNKLGVNVEDYNSEQILVDNDVGLIAVSKESVKHSINFDDEERQAKIEDRIGSIYGGFDDDGEEEVV